MYRVALATRDRALHRDAFAVVTTVCGITEVCKAVVRGYVMATGSLDRFTIVLLATGYPVEVGLLAFALWYLRRAGVSFRAEASASHV